MSALQRDLLKNKLPPLPNKHAGGSRFSGLVPKRKVKDYTASDWTGYFEKQFDVPVGDNTFRLYASGSAGPVILLLHGGGHSALSWAVFTKTLCGMCECQVIAIDFRGHGETKTIDNTNMSADILARDMANVVTAFYGNCVPPLVMMGHSMGGAIAVHIGVKKLIPSLNGLVVIDVVEGTALDALSSMQSFLRSRPQRFKSVDHAIEWSIRSGQLRNLDSARISMIGQLKKVQKESGETQFASLDIAEESEESANEAVALSSSNAEEPSEYTWKVDLSKTEPHWKGIDRLDKDLTIGQMQGKFQMQVLPNCGHMVHEDVPDKVAEILTGFLLRQKLTVAKGNFESHTPAC